MEIYQKQELDIGKSLLCLSVVTCTLFGNVVIVFSYFQNYKMRTVTNALVINHCLTDMLLAISDIAFYVTPAYIPSLMESNVFCILSTFFDSLFKAAAFLSMVCIAFDRYHNLVRACRKRMTKERVTVLIAWVWVQATVAAAPWNELIGSDHVARNAITCAFHRTLPLLFEVGSAINALSIVFKIICVIFPLLSIYYVSYRVFNAGRTRRRVDIQHSLSIRRRFSSEHFAVRSAPAKITAIFLLGVYIICTAPFLVAVIWTMFPKNHFLVPGVAFAVYFMFRLKGSLFPLIYITRNRVVLNSIQKLACCCKSRAPFSSQAFVTGDPRNQDWKKHLNGPGPEQISFNRRQERTKEQRIFCVLDFTDLTTARRNSRVGETSI